MRVFEANISRQVSDYLKESLKYITTFEAANQKILTEFGISQFFDFPEELFALKEALSYFKNHIEDPDRAEYGDFQTNSDLANKVSLHLTSKSVLPEIILEPTCGKGNFVIASLRNFKTIKKVFCIEIYKPYVWETKFNVLDYFISNPTLNKPEINIIHCNVFDFDFKALAAKCSNSNILVIGNPPWVTNSKLGSLNSKNLPRKSNFKNNSGLDAMTGKGNFDIAEFITISLLEKFQSTTGYLALLVKNSVVKNIVFEQKRNRFKISTIEKHCIDSKKEFNVSVEASLFFCKLNSKPTLECSEYNFYDNGGPHLKFGWLNDKFISNIATYKYTKEIDGVCPFEWRQGLKHDCSNIMELEKENGHYVNGLNELVRLEEDLVYGILKSSDLKNQVITDARKYTIVTQRKVGQETKYIRAEFPKTYQYLVEHQASFEARKSSIYNNKPLFSIFGIGDYSFKRYKVAISGLYKTFHFSLILPKNNKPLMLDDTCYLIGFDKLEFAVYSLILLNSEKTVRFLQSVTFPDAKRTFTKDVLMRIDLLALAKNTEKAYIKSELEALNSQYNITVTLSLWDNFISKLLPITNGQIEMFT